MHQHGPAWPRLRSVTLWICSVSCLEKAFHCFILSCIITLCAFPVSNEQVSLRLVVLMWYHLLHRLFPSISWHTSVPGVPMSIGSGMNVAEGWCPGTPGCSHSAEHSLTVAAPHFQMHTQRNSLD